MKLFALCLFSGLGLSAAYAQSQLSMCAIYGVNPKTGQQVLVDATETIMETYNYGDAVKPTAFPPNLSAGFSYLPAKIVAPGEVLAILGGYVGNTTAGTTYYTTVPLTTRLPVNGYQIEMLANGLPTPLFGAGQRFDQVYSLESGEIAFQLPDTLSSDTVTLQIRQTDSTGNQCVGNTFALPVAPLAGSLYKSVPNGVNIYDAITYKQLNQVASGQWLTFYGYGFGGLTIPVAAGTPAPLVVNPTIAKVTFTVDGHSAQVSYAGAAPGNIGLYQFNVQLPALLPGTHQATLFADGSPVESFALTVQ